MDIKEQISKCTKCNKILNGFWQMENNPKNLIYQQKPSGRFLGITNGHFLKSHDDWVNVYCYNCFIIQIKTLSFNNSTPDQLTRENIKLRTIISNLNNEKSMVYNDFKSISCEKNELNEVMSILSNEKETLGMDFEKFSNENQELKSRIIDLNKEIENLKSEIIEKNEEISEKDKENREKENFIYRKIFDFCGFDKLKFEMEILTHEERVNNIGIDIDQEKIFKEFENELNDFAVKIFEETKNKLLENIEKEIEFSKENILNVKNEILKYENSMTESRIPQQICKLSITPLENYSISLESYIDRLNILNQRISIKESFHTEAESSKILTENFDIDKSEEKSYSINNDGDPNLSNLSVSKENFERNLLNEDNKSNSKIFITENSNSINPDSKRSLNSEKGNYDMKSEMINNTHSNIN